MESASDQPEPESSRLGRRMAGMNGGFPFFVKVVVLYFFGHLAITYLGSFYVHGGVGYEQGTRHRFISILNLQWVMIFCSWLVYRQLMGFFDSPFTLVFTHLKPNSLATESYKRKTSLTLLVIFALAHITYFLYYFDGFLQMFLFEVCSITLGVWTHMVFFSLGFFFLNSTLNILKSFKCCSRFLDRLRRIPFIQFLLWDRHVQVVFSVVVTLVVSLICLFSADYIFIRTAELPIANLPPQAEGLRIAVLSDLHTGGTVRRDEIAKVVDRTNDMNVDAVFIVGDMTDGTVEQLEYDVVDRTNDMNVDAVFIVGDMTDGTVEQLEYDVEPLRHLRSRLGTYMVTGNHDYYFDDAMAWIRLFKSYGIKVLTNSKTDLEGICLIGLNDISSGQSGIPHHEMNISTVITECEPSKPVIVLSHNPASAKHISESNLSYNGVDLIISGHTHSGQFYVMLPFVYLVLPYVHGLYTVPMKFVSHDATLLVTAGTLYQGPPMKMLLYSNIWEVTLMGKHTSELVDLE
uniref:Metallophos domain-containing protein n=1 Tax=Steinernema glaseri TaxID=37863 RepID=A0A1I8A037_9BILA